MRVHFDNKGKLRRVSPASDENLRYYSPVKVQACPSGLDCDGYRTITHNTPDKLFCDLCGKKY